MNSVRGNRAKTGSAMGLSFLLLVGPFLQAGVNLPEKKDPGLTFREINSTCINLAHYDAKAKRLTVRFVDRDRDTQLFYRYSKVPAKVWRKLNKLNESDGGVGNYFTTTIVQHPEKYPFEKISIREFKTIPKNKRPEIRYESPAV